MTCALPPRVPHARAERDRIADDVSSAQELGTETEANKRYRCHQSRLSTLMQSLPSSMAEDRSSARELGTGTNWQWHRTKPTAATAIFPSSCVVMAPNKTHRCHRHLSKLMQPSTLVPLVDRHWHWHLQQHRKPPLPRLMLSSPPLPPIKDRAAVIVSSGGKVEH